MELFIQLLKFCIQMASSSEVSSVSPAACPPVPMPAVTPALTTPSTVAPTPDGQDDILIESGTWHHDVFAEMRDMRTAGVLCDVTLIGEA